MKALSSPQSILQPLQNLKGESIHRGINNKELRCSSMSLGFKICRSLTLESVPAMTHQRLVKPQERLPARLVNRLCSIGLERIFGLIIDMYI